MRTLILIILCGAALAAPALAWRTYSGEYNPSTGWPGVRVSDDAGHVLAVVSFLTPNASFSVPYITLSETTDEADIAAWNEFDKKANPVFAKRLNGATPAFNTSDLKIYDYLPQDVWDKCGGNAGFINRQVRLVVGYLKGTKWKKVEVSDYEPDPTMLGVVFKLEAAKEATPMGPIVWGYWYP